MKNDYMWANDIKKMKYPPKWTMLGKSIQHSFLLNVMNEIPFNLKIVHKHYTLYR